SDTEHTAQTEPKAERQAAEEKLLETAALGEGYSNHPIALSLREAYGKEMDMERVSGAEEIAGYGVRVQVDGKEVLLGNEKLMQKEQISYVPYDSIGTVVYVAQEGQFLGAVVISDTIKEGAKQALSDMKKIGVKKSVMLTGDREKTAQSVAQELGIDEIHAQLLPADKVSCVEQLLKNQPEKERLAFVGDGINDAPVLTRADLGIAMGSMGSDAAIEAADIVLMDDDIQKIAAIVRISRKTMRIVKQNIIFALGVKALVLLLGAFGAANMWEAVFADVGVSVIAIVNSMRTLHTK
ncbi:MAG: HAD-IC family P-type ATPase, partial [Eubacterium sp.]|nr:HAD-IC family P-type ATPase [Eubacterium sp.]